MKTSTKTSAFYYKLVFVFSIVTFTNTFAATITSNGTGGGTWATGSTWVGGVAPASADIAIIASGDVVTLGAAVTRTGSTTVTGTLALAGFSFTTGDIQGAGTISSASGTPILTTGSNNASTTFSGLIGTGAITLIKNGTGALTLSGNNTFTGGVTLNAGTLNINHANAMGTNTGTFTIAGGTTIDNTSGAAITTNNYHPQLNGDFTFTGTNSLNLNTRGVFMGADVQITTVANTLTIGGTNNNPTYSLTKAGAGSLVFGSTNVTINNLTISAGTLTSTSGTLSLAGNFTNNGTYTHNNGTVIFNGTSNQTLGGSSSTTFYNLTINTSGTTVTTGVDITVNNNLTVSNGTLSIGAFGFAVTGTATVNNSTSTLSITSATGAKSFGNLTINNSTFTNSGNSPITINGNLQNNGTFTQGTGRVTFTGNSSNTISGSSTSAFGGGITVDKGATNANILDVQCVITMLSGGLTLTNGTFKLSSASTITPFTADISTAPYLIPSTAGIWCDGGTMSASANNWSCDGLLRVSGGTVTIGTAADGILGPKPNSTIWIEGGNLNVSGRISNPTFTWTFNMTGGTMTLCTVGSTTASRAPFYMDQSGSSFTMSGGTIVIQRPGAGNLGFYNMATSGSGFTGGTLQIGNASTPAASTIGITSTNAIYNLTVNSANVTAQLQSSTLTVSNNVTITTGTLDGNSLSMNVGNDWTDNGTFTPGTGRVTFNSSKLIQNITNPSGETFYRLTANSTGNLQLNNNVMVTNNLTMASGFINLNGNTLTLGNSAGASLTHSGATATAYGGTFKRWWPVGAISSSAGNLYGLFPVGTANDYRPIAVNSTVNPTTAGYVSGTHTDAVTITEVTYTDNEGDAIVRIQNMKSSLSTSGLAGGTYNLDIVYTCLSATGILPDMKLETYTGGVMGSVGTNGTTIGPVTAPTAQRTGVTLAQLSNDFVIATKNEINTPLRQYFYSRKSGNWTDATAGNATWSYVGSGSGASCDCTPGTDGYAVISAGHTVSVDAATTVHYVDVNTAATLNGTANMTINYDLTTYGSGKFTPTTGTWQVSRDLYVVSGSSSSIPSGGMTVSNDLILNGALAVGAGNTLTVNGSHNNIIGTGSMTGTGTFRVITGNREITTGTNLSINPTFAIVGSITVANAGTMTLLGNLTGSSGNSTWSNDDNSTLNVAGTVLTTGKLNAFGINNTVNYNRNGGTQTIKIPTNSSYYNLTCSVAGTKSLAGNMSVTNLLTISGTAVIDASTYNFNGSAGVTMNNSSRLILSDISLADQQLPAFAGAYTLGSGTTIEFAGAGTQNANGIAYQNVDITGNNAASSLNIANISSISGNLTLTNQAQINSNGALTITGNLNYGSSQTSTIVNSVTVNGAGGASFTAGTFDMNDENLTTSVVTLGAGGTLLGGAGNLTVTGNNWTNNGGTFTPENGTVIFGGTANQAIGGSAGTTFYNLTLNNTGGNSVITLSKPITVSNTLTLTDGILATDATNLLTLTNSSSSATTGGNSTGPSFVKGPMRWNGLNGAGPFIFPTGAGTSKWARVGVSGVTSATDFTASYTNTPYSNVSSAYLSTAVTPTLTNVSILEYWDVARTSGAGNAAVTLYWENASASGINSCASNGNLKVAHYNSSSTNKWENANTSGTIVVTGSCSGSAAGTVTSDVMTSFSPFTFSSGNSGVNPLPIELLNFNAVFNGTTTDISWETASEINNNYFTVERSTDGINFTTLSTITSKALNGNSTSKLSYALNDPNTVSGVYYYRLKQTDFDFKYTYSNIVPVTIASSVEFSFDLAPNPNDGGAMEGFIKTPYSGMVTFKIYNMAGNRLAMQDIQVKVEEKNPFKIQFKDRLESGTYIVIAILNGDLTKKKLMMVVR